MDEVDSEYYPGYNKDFDKVLNKYEFKNQAKRDFTYYDPRQLLLRNFISQNTLYDSILLKWDVGTGKTLASICIAESFKEYISNMNRKIFVLVKNKNIEKNFKAELMSKGGGYLTDQDREILNDPTFSNEDKDVFMRKINKRINKSYEFVPYGTFDNQILGSKVFEKDIIGQNTKVQKKIDGVGLRSYTNNTNGYFNNSVVIIDEVHNVLNNNTYLSLVKTLQSSYNYRLVLLTATPMKDNVKEILELSNLLNMNNPENILPIRNESLKGDNPLMVINDSYKSDIIKGSTVDITDYGREQLIKALRGKVSYLESNTKTFPTKIDKGVPINNVPGSIRVIPCEMSEYQHSIYLKALASDLKVDIDTISKLESDDNMNNCENDENDNEICNKSSAVYQYSINASNFVYPDNLYGKEGFMECFNEDKKKNIILKKKYTNIFTTDLEMYSSKLYKLLKNINKSPGNLFIYSNYVKYGGTALVKQLLKSNGYHEYNSHTQHPKTFVLYDTLSTNEKREKIRRLFNSDSNKNGKYIQIIIGSPIISEGITLKNVRQIHILEPHWNMSRLDQIIGRGVRHHSHDKLPESERTVEIYKYCSVYRDLSDVLSIDKEKYVLSEEKNRSNKKIERLLKEIAFDCNINVGLKYNLVNGSPECDYTNCNYKCDIKSQNTGFDKSTYNLYIDFFDKYDIEWVTTIVKKLFKEYFIWSIDSILDKVKDYTNIISNESVFTALEYITNEKTILTDSFNREGYIIQKGLYFIFNPLNIDINTSIYSKILDFNVFKNKFDLNEYAKIKLNIDLDTVNNNVLKYEKSKKIEKISDLDILYNDNLIKNNKLIGTYRGRAIKNEKYGIVDNVFKLIDLKDKKNDSDNRTKITGMTASSYNKKRLFGFINDLNIDIKDSQRYLGYPGLKSIDLLQINQLIYIIEQNLIQKHLILK